MEGGGVSIPPNQRTVRPKNPRLMPSSSFFSHRSGRGLPPFNYNGFVAKIEFLRPKEEEEEEEAGEERGKEGGGGGRRRKKERRNRYGI